MEPLVWARDLVKRYGALTAVDAISFQVAHQECYGLLGPNGAGKTTTIRMICCVSPPTSGSHKVATMDVRRHPRKIKALLGVVPQETNLDPDLTVLQNLLVYCRYFGIPAREARARAAEALELFQLAEKRGATVDQLSGGMKRRLLVARALINRPSLLVLDEPTSGLDPQARYLVWEKLEELKGGGVTMILTTHYMEEAARLCDRVAIMDGGKIVAEGEPRRLVADHVGVESMTQRPATLEDVFFKLTGHALRE